MTRSPFARGRLDHAGCVFGGLVDADKFVLPAGKIVVLEIDDDDGAFAHGLTFLLAVQRR